MPELPEVETIVRELQPRLQGRTIVQACVWDELLVRFPSTVEFQKRLLRRIESVGRRGKYIVMNLEGQLTWLIHLRMTGQLLVRQPEDTPHLRARFDMDDGSWLWYLDVRRFGDMWAFLPGEDARLGGFVALGPEPLGPEFSGQWLYQRGRCRRIPLKCLLLDQKVVAGLGNIYADEALFVAGINPCLPASALAPEHYEALAQAIKGVIAAAVKSRGTTFRDYRTADGKSGDYQQRLSVYGRKGQHCRRCGDLLTGTTLAGRSTVFCPRCQPGRGNDYNNGTTGKGGRG